MLDGYAWIRSEEIREYLRKNYKLSFKERMQLVRSAHRPMEERLQALRMLQKEAVTPREKGFAAQVIRLYEFMLREIRESRSGQFYIRKLPCPAALDASGAALLPGVAAGPMVIKPNTDELTQLTGKTFHSTQDILAACRQIIEGGVSVCAVSMGKEGALITDGSKAFFAGSVVENPDSTVGAGDSMLAGILSVITRGGAIDEALRVGSAAAAATISLPGTNLATPKLIQEFLAKVTTTELEF